MGMREELTFEQEKELKLNIIDPENLNDFIYQSDMLIRNQEIDLEIRLACLDFNVACLKLSILIKKGQLG